MVNGSHPIPPSEKDSPSLDSQPINDSQQSGNEEDSEDGNDRSHIEVVAKISTHALREERAFHICKSLIKSVDPEGHHIVRPIDILHLPQQPNDKRPLVVCIFENPGENYLGKVLDYGPAYYRSRKVGDRYDIIEDEFNPDESVPLETFLDFAIGAAECLEILHHGQRIVHGEIRGDAFHMNQKTGRVRLISFGSGLRTFEHGLTSYGWSALSKEMGAKTKLSYMSPEQVSDSPRFQDLP